MTTNINYAYIRDPMCFFRIVTIAYTNNPAIQAGAQPEDKQSITYAFAINRIDAFRRAPQRIRFRETSDMHRKEIGREVASYRLENIGATSVGHCYAKIGQNPIQAIIAEHLRQYIPSKQRRRRGLPETPMYLQKVSEVFLRVVQLSPTTERK